KSKRRVTHKSTDRPLSRKRPKWYRPVLEALEDRTLPSGNPFSTIASQLDGALKTVMQPVDTIVGNAKQLPFVGDNLAGLQPGEFLKNQIEDPVQQALNQLAAEGGTPADSDIQTTVASFLGSKLGDTNGDGVISSADVVVTHPSGG